MNAGFLADELRRADYDLYLQTLFYKGKTRDRLQALASLNHEISRTRSMVTDTNLGLIRLQWWRDEISKVYQTGACGRIPQLSTLAPLISNGQLPFENFETLLFAREFDLEDVAPASLSGLRHYIDFTHTPLNALMLKIVEETAEIEEIQRVSINFGMIRIIRSVPFMLSQGRCLLPDDLMSAKNLDAQKIIHNNCKADIVETIQHLCQDIVTHSKPKSPWLRRQSKHTDIYLRHLRKCNFDVFSPDFCAVPPLLALRLAFA